MWAHTWFIFFEEKVNKNYLGGSIALPGIGSLYPILKKCAKFLPELIIDKIPYGEHIFFVDHEEHIEGLYDLNKENKGIYPGLYIYIYFFFI